MGKPAKDLSEPFTLLSVVVLVLLLGSAIVLFRGKPLFLKARGLDTQFSCLANVKQISLAMLQYCQDHDQRFPLAPASCSVEQMDQAIVTGDLQLGGYYGSDDWRMSLYPYLMNNQIFVCPSTESAYSYQLNDNLYAKQYNRITQPAELIGVYETGFLDQSSPPPHNDRYVVGFVDGHCKCVENLSGWRTRP